MAAREDIENLKAQGIDLKLDFILNHLSVLSPSSRTFCKRGTTPPTGISSLTGTNSGPDAGHDGAEGYIQLEPRYIREMFFFRKPGSAHPDGAPA